MSKQFLVVGGSHGIGRGIVRNLLSAGGRVTIVSRTIDPGDLVDGVVHVEADVTADELDPSLLPDSIDGLAYCPGSINLGPFRQLRADAMMDDFRLNVVGATKCLQAAMPAMKASGRSSVVMFSTVAVAKGMPMHASVAASKGAVEGLARSLAAELAPRVRVNCIAPALTDTPLSAKFLSSDAKRAAMSDKYPLKRVGEIEDIASMATFLLSDQSSWITGQVLAVDGGMSTLAG